MPAQTLPGRDAAHWIAIAILGGFGLAFVAGSFATVRLFAWEIVPTHLATRDWAQADAKLEQVALDRDHRSGSARSSGERWQLRTRYRYTVDDRVYGGTRASLADLTEAGNARLAALHRRLDDSWRLGSSVPVHYDPDAPHRALLDTRMPWAQASVGILLTLLLLPLGLVFLLAAWLALRAGADARRLRSATKPSVSDCAR